MDQIYIPKNRAGFSIGNYVVIKPLESGKPKKPIENLYFYGIKNLEPLKLEIVHEVLRVIDESVSNYENIFITGSFLDEGFHFDDIDIIVLVDDIINQEQARRDIERKTGIKGHILVLSNKEFYKGLETDPLYQMILSRCVAKKRFIYKKKQIIDYKILDLHLLKSKILIDNFDMLSGKEKYDLVRNTIAIYLYLAKKKTTVESVDKEIKKSLGANVQEIKDNVLDKKAFLMRYKLVYDKSFDKIIKGIEHGSKQK